MDASVPSVRCKPFWGKRSDLPLEDGFVDTYDLCGMAAARIRLPRTAIPTMSVESAQNLSQSEIFRRIIALRNEGSIYDLEDPILDSVFCGSADRYATIAFALQGFSKVLDVGCGTGLLLAILSKLGHVTHGVDIMHPADAPPPLFARHGIQYHRCNVELDTYPHRDESFDAVTCCQVMEHFTHSHLHAAREFRRVLRPGGCVEIDVPNVASFRNRLRLLRGKNITWDYRDHYLLTKPLFHQGHSLYPIRHNREFTRKELHLLLQEAGFHDIQVVFFKDENYRTGMRRLLSLGSAVRNLVPGIRKSLLATARKT